MRWSERLNLEWLKPLYHNATYKSFLLNCPIFSAVHSILCYHFDLRRVFALSQLLFRRAAYLKARPRYWRRVGTCGEHDTCQARYWVVCAPLVAVLELDGAGEFAFIHCCCPSVFHNRQLACSCCAHNPYCLSHTLHFPTFNGYVLFFWTHYLYCPSIYYSPLHLMQSARRAPAKGRNVVFIKVAKAGGTTLQVI